MYSGREKGASALSYLSWIFFIIAILMTKDNRNEFVNTHLNQGFNLNLISTIFAMFARSGMLPEPVSFAISFVILVFLVVGVVSAIMGKTLRIPVIGSFQVFK